MSTMESISLIIINLSNYEVYTYFATEFDLLTPTASRKLYFLVFTPRQPTDAGEAIGTGVDQVSTIKDTK
jgi:hypothetical protein